MWLQANRATLCLHTNFAACRVQLIHKGACADQQLAHDTAMLDSDGSHLLI